MSPEGSPSEAAPGRHRRRRAEGAPHPDAPARGHEPLDVRAVDPPAPFPLLEVRNPSHGTRYQVALPGFPEKLGALCSCEDFSRRGKGTCKHIEAAFVALRAQPPTRVPPPSAEWAESVWAEIDRRQPRLTPGACPGPRDLRAAGRAVIEARDPYGLGPIPAPDRSRRPA
jgi:SWIM zinc finger